MQEAPDPEQIAQHGFHRAVLPGGESAGTASEFAGVEGSRSCTFTAETFGTQRTLPGGISPRRPRICEVSGATTTSARASAGWG